MIAGANARRTVTVIVYISILANILFIGERMLGKLRNLNLNDEDYEEIESVQTLHRQQQHQQHLESNTVNTTTNQCLVHVGPGRCEEAFAGHHDQQLTHVVMPFHTSQLARVENNLKMWLSLPPCTAPSSYHLVLYSSADTKKRSQIADIETRLQAAVGNLTSEVLQCFTSIDIQHANLSGSSDTYYKGTRLMIEKLITGRVKLAGTPQYVFYMEPDCYPLRGNWLAALDASVRWPNQSFWMKGSIYRGYNKGVYATRHPPQYFHINGNAIYNVGDKSFKTWYLRHYRQYVQAAQPRKDRSFDTDFWRFLYDLDNVMVARQIIHKFVYTEVIVNYWKSSYSTAKLKETFPNTYLVHGGYPKV